MKITDILWDTEGQRISWLPKEVIIEEDLDAAAVSDLLSNVYGFCQFSFCMEH